MLTLCLFFFLWVFVCFEYHCISFSLKYWIIAQNEEIWWFLGHHYFYQVQFIFLVDSDDTTTVEIIVSYTCVLFRLYFTVSYYHFGISIFRCGVFFGLRCLPLSNKSVLSWYTKFTCSGRTAQYTSNSICY